MKQAIIVGSCVIAAALLANLGYEIHRDQAQAETARIEKLNLERARVAEFRFSEGLRAWKKTAGEGSQMEKAFWTWLTKNGFYPKQYFGHHLVMVKPYSSSDVKWISSSTVEINGLISDSYLNHGQWFRWKVTDTLGEDREWDKATPDFYEEVEKDNETMKKSPVFVIYF